VIRGGSVCICSSGTGYVIKQTKVVEFSLMPNIGAPLFPRRMPSNTFNTRFAVSCNALVLHVFGAICRAQIGPSVVSAVAVDVVNFVRGPFARHIEKRKPVSKIGFPANTDLGIALGLEPCGCPCGPPALGDKPSEYSRLGIVVEKFAQTLRGKIGLSHAVVPLKQWFGQRPASADNASGLRYFRGFV